MYVLWGTVNPIYGLMRINAMKKVRLNLQTFGQDLIILSELSFMGHFAHNPEAIWFRRMQREDETTEQRIERYKKTLFSSNSILLNFFPHITIPFELWRSITKAKISVKDKIYMFLLSIVAFPIKYYICKR